MLRIIFLIVGEL